MRANLEQEQERRVNIREKTSRRRSRVRANLEQEQEKKVNIREKTSSKSRGES